MQKNTLCLSHSKEKFYLCTNLNIVNMPTKPNRELRGRILTYGENLEVVSPLSLREQIKDTLKRQLTQYLDKTEPK